MKTDCLERMRIIYAEQDIRFGFFSEMRNQQDNGGVSCSIFDFLAQLHRDLQHDVEGNFAYVGGGISLGGLISYCVHQRVYSSNFGSRLIYSALSFIRPLRFLLLNESGHPCVAKVSNVL